MHSRLHSVLLMIVLVSAISACARVETPNPFASGDISTVLFSTPADSSVACYRIPALASTGRVLLAAIDERVPSCVDLRGGRDIKILVRRSEDGGQTWSAPETVLAYADGIAASDPSFIEDAETGRIFMFANVMDHDSAHGEYRFHVTSTDDGGKTWSEPQDITDDMVPADWKMDFKFITSGRGIQTTDGTLLHTVVNLDNGLHVMHSTDHGRSWGVLPGALTPGDESKIVERHDGSWLVNSRVGGAGHRWIHVSEDRGTTWTSMPDSSLTDPAVNAALVRHAEGWIFVNANHPDERRNMTIRVSGPDQESWAVAEVVESGSAAYVTAELLDDGSLGLLYERRGYTETVFRRIPSDVVDAWFSTP